MGSKHLLVLVVAATVVVFVAQGTALAQEEPPPGCEPEDPRPECDPPPLPPPPTPQVPTIDDDDIVVGGGGRKGADATPPVIEQDAEQEAESGDVSQSFEVSGDGDNSNRCIGLLGAANTGNAQNQTGIIHSGSGTGDFEFEDSGGTIEVDGVTGTACGQRVSQAAASSGV